MDKQDTVTIFHIYRKDGSALFLHPFDKLEDLLKVTHKKHITGKYGKEPRVESITLFRNDLYRMIEAAVLNYIAEIRFIPRFLISAGVFLVTYFLLSFVIRDPLPMIDELVISLGASIACYFIIRQKDKNSRLALKKRSELRGQVDSIRFEHDPFVEEVESALHKNEETEKDELIDRLVSASGDDIAFMDEPVAREMLSYLEKRFPEKGLKKQEKRLTRIQTSVAGEGEKTQFTKWAEVKKIDLSLFDVYRRLKKSCFK